MEKPNKQVWVTKKTKERLFKRKNMGDTFEDVIIRLLDEVEAKH